MSFVLKTDQPPLREDESGALRVGDTRVLLELVIQAFREGATPEAIVQRYSTLTLSDVYSVIAYYLRHRVEIEEYLEQRARKADDVQRQIEAQQGDLSDIRRRLEERQIQHIRAATVRKR